MPDAPHVATSEVDSPIAKLNERGDDQASAVAGLTFSGRPAPAGVPRG
jgi:hypothetical protein